MISLILFSFLGTNLLRYDHHDDATNLQVYAEPLYGPWILYICQHSSARIQKIQAIIETKFPRQKQREWNIKKLNKWNFFERRNSNWARWKKRELILHHLKYNSGQNVYVYISLLNYPMCAFQVWNSSLIIEVTRTAIVWVSFLADDFNSETGRSIYIYL